MTIHAAPVADYQAQQRTNAQAKVAARAEATKPRTITSPEQGAAALGCVWPDDFTAAGDDLLTVVGEVLTDGPWLHQLRERARVVRPGDATPQTPPAEHMAGLVLDRARSLQANREQAAQRQAEKVEQQTCPVTGQVDPTTRRRQLPWATDKPWGRSTASVVASDRGVVALMAAALATVTPAELERATAILAGTLPDPTPEQTSGRKRRR